VLDSLGKVAHKGARQNHRLENIMDKQERIKWLQDKLAGMPLGGMVRRKYENELWVLLGQDL